MTSPDADNPSAGEATGVLAGFLERRRGVNEANVSGVLTLNGSFWRRVVGVVGRVLVLLPRRLRYEVPGVEGVEDGTTGYSGYTGDG